MRHLLNTLFVTTEDAYLTLDGDNVVIKQKETGLGRFPLHTLENIFCFSYAGASPSLMGACGRRGISLCFLTPNGRFLASTHGEQRGNVLLRRKQHQLTGDEAASCEIARNFIFGKVYNCRWSIERTLRDHAMRLDREKLKKVSKQLAAQLPEFLEIQDLDSLRGLEGEAATLYFSVFDQMILNEKDDFRFERRSRRPPLDNVNALLSFAYTLLANDCASALESVGLDPYMGYLHRDRPGRRSLALDLMEELRSVMADRFVLTLINNRMVSAADFQKQESGAVLMEDACRKKFITAYQGKKQETIIHPYLKEKIPWGLVPYIQALLLSRHMRGDLDGYPPFLWK